MNGKWTLSVSILVMVLITGCLGGGDEEEPDLEGKAGVEFTTAEGTKLLSLTCELADTAEERSEGLMHRTELGSDEGMVFYYNPPREVSFWMKNTLIPLDMVFVGSDFIVKRVSQADPEPGVADDDLTRYPSGTEVMYVIEMNQGLADRFGIVPGVGVTVWEY